MSKRIGKNQRSVLECLADRGPWPGTGWTWSNDSETRRILQSLVRRGLVRTGLTPAQRIIYLITEDGLIELHSTVSDSEILRRATRPGARAMYRNEAKRRNLL